jgi:hypothetical protein
MDSRVMGIAAPEGRPSVAQGATLGMARTVERPSPSPEGATVRNAEVESVWSDDRPSGLGKMECVLGPQGCTLGY